MTAVLVTPDVTIGRRPEETCLRTFEALLDALSCSGPEALERLIGHSHGLDVVVEDCPRDGGHGERLLLRVEDWGLKLDFPMTLRDFWDEVERLETAALDGM